MAGEVTQAISQKELWGGGRSPFSTSYGKMMMWFFLISDALTFGGLLTSLGFMKHKFADMWPVSENVFYHFPFTHAHLPLLYVALMTFILIVSSVTMVLAVEAGHRLDKRGVIFWLALTVVGGFIFVGSQAWEWSTFIDGNGLQSNAFQVENRSIAHVKFTKEYLEAHPHATFNLNHETEKTINEDPMAEAIARLTAGHMYLELAHERERVEGEAAVAELSGSTHIQGANLHVNEYGHNLYADFFFFITGFHGFHVFSGVIINLTILIMVIKGVMHKRKHYEMVEKVGLYWHFVDLVWVFVFTFFYLV